MFGGNSCAWVPRVRDPDHYPWQEMRSVGVVMLSDDRRQRGQLEGGMVNVGGGDIDHFEEGGSKLEIVSRSVEKLMILRNLTQVA